MPKKDYTVHPHYGIRISAEEEWRDVPGYEGLYQVSNQGRVRSVDHWVPHQGGRYHVRAKMLRTDRPSNKGSHPKISLCRVGKEDYRFVHRLVLEAFVGPCPPGMEACHYDDKFGSNRLENLRWDTHKGNGQDRVRNGKCSEMKHWAAVITVARSIKIRRLLNRGWTRKEVARRFGISWDTVANIHRGRHWTCQKIKEEAING